MAKRGRPKGSKNKPKTVELEHDSVDPFDKLSDSEVLGDIHTRFEVMQRIAQSCIDGDVRSAVISGAAGIGKTYTLDQLLKRKSDANEKFRFRIVKGAITPVNLFKILQDYRHPGNVVVLDDADNIFFDDAGVSLLKAALDSTPERWISWLAESNALLTTEGDYDREFKYEGTMVFITNTDFQGIVDGGKSKLAPHFGALISRSMYLDLAVHHRRAIAIWVHYLCSTTNLLKTHYGLDDGEQKTCLDWMMANQDQMRSLSIRDAMKLGQLMKSEPRTWEETAGVLLLRQKYV